VKVTRGLMAIESSAHGLLTGPPDGDPFREAPERTRAARRRAEALGHALTKFRAKDRGARHVAMCRRCAALVIVNLGDDGGTYGTAVCDRCGEAS